MPAAWCKSRRSYGTGDCVEVRFVNQMCNGDYLTVLVEDSAKPHQQMVMVHSDAWRQFIASVKNGWQPA